MYDDAINWTCLGITACFVFVTLKLLKLLHWNWIFVMSPLILVCILLFILASRGNDNE